MVGLKNVNKILISKGRVITMKEYNVEIKPHALNLMEYNRIENEKYKLLLKYGYTFKNPLEAKSQLMENEEDYKAYQNLLRQSEDNDRESSVIIMNLYRLGYNNSQLPGRSELDNFINWNERLRSN